MTSADKYRQILTDAADRMANDMQRRIAAAIGHHIMRLRVIAEHAARPGDVEHVAVFSWADDSVAPQTDDKGNAIALEPPDAL
jgi:hypothetical protein